MDRETVETPDARRTRLLRNGFAKTLIIIGALLLGLAIPATWLNRTVMDTDQWVATVEPLASDPAIQTVLGDAAADAILDRVDIQGYLDELLPAQLRSLSTPIGASVEGFVRSQTNSFVESDKFADVWVEVNRKSHSAIMSAITGTSEGAVQTGDGAIMLDVGDLADEILVGLTERGVPLADRIPAGSIDKQVTLYRSPGLARASAAIDYLNRSAIWLPWLGLLLVVGGITLAKDRRSAILWLGVAAVLVTLVPLRAIYLGQSSVARAALQLGQSESAAAQAAYQIIFADLISSTRLFVVVALVIWGAAVIAGPSRWAIAGRRGLSRALSGIGDSWDLGAIGAWVAGHKPELRAAGYAITALIFVAVPIRSFGLLSGLLGGLFVWLAIIELVGSVPRSAEDSAVDPGSI